jgi:hypothetical protein
MHAASDRCGRAFDLTWAFLGCRLCIRIVLEATGLQQQFPTKAVMLEIVSLMRKAYSQHTFESTELLAQFKPSDYAIT